MQLALNIHANSLPDTLAKIFSISAHTAQSINASQKTKFSQYFTEGTIAQTLANELSSTAKHIVDPGCGAGILGATALCTFLSQNPSKKPLKLTGYELDASLHEIIQLTMEAVNDYAFELGLASPRHTLHKDFLSDSGTVIKQRRASLDAAILNPPYKKLNQSTPLAQFIKANFCSTPNEYAAFMVLAIDMLKDGGEMVAIVPRSFTSGTYFKEFRVWLRAQGSIEWLHRYDSRSNVFRAENVLQENVLLKFRKGVEQASSIRVTSSCSPDTPIQFSMAVDHALMLPEDPKAQILVPASKDEVNAIRLNASYRSTFSELGVTLTTGKLEDFRYRELLSSQHDASCLPVIYSQHINLESRELEWTDNITKPCYAMATDALIKKAIPRGNYLLIKRISANDKSAKRCHASMLLEDNPIQGHEWLIENHVQVIGLGNQLTKAQVMSLYDRLTSDEVELLFRATSGTTQLNKDDISIVRL